MKFPSTRARLLASSMICGLTLGVFSQASAATANEVEELVVTGSRIPQPNLTSSSPITVVGQVEMKLQGTTNIENVIRDLPAVMTDGDNQTVNNSSNGLSTIDLRGLGPHRTLILLDGKRIQPADQFGSVDLNQFPAGMVDHVEVLTGGASSAYGGDAVSGVVNLIPRKNFEGLELNTQNTLSGHGDGRITDVNLLLGVNSSDHKGNVTLYADFMDRQAVFQGARKFSFFELNSPYLAPCGATATLNLFGGFCAGGSPGIPEGRITAGAGRGSIFSSTRTLIPDDGRTYNFNPINYLQTPDTRYAFGAYGHYELSASMDFYSRVTFAQNEAFNQLAETPINAIFTTNFGNPNISAQERAILFPAAAAPVGGYTNGSLATFKLRRRLVENGPRVTHDTHDSYQIEVGLKGELGPGWTYDFSAHAGTTKWGRVLSGDANQVKFGQGLLVNPDGTCMSGGSCVPVDIFSTNSISQKAVKFFTVGAVADGTTTQQDVQANIVGDLASLGGKFPWAHDAIGIAIGAEYRREASKFEPDDNLGHNGQLLGFGASPAISGSYDTQELYGEFRAPLVQDMPFVRNLQIEGGYRFADYNLSGAAHSYKIAFDYSPTESFRLRGSYDRAVREPNINELYAAATPSADTGADPCASEGATVGYTTTAALCHATGVPANVPFRSPDLDCGGQCTSHWLSNSTLTPEEADTKSIGIVFTPTFLHGLTGSIDYYDILINKSVFRIPLTQVLQQCYDPALNPSQSATNASCAAVHRDSLGTISSTDGFVNLPFANIGSQKVRGVDFVASYKDSLDLIGLTGWGSFGIDFLGNLTTALSYKGSSTLPVTDCLGLYGQKCGVPAPKWRHNMRVTWYSPGKDISLSARWRYIGGTKFDQVVQNGVVDPLDDHISGRSYFDLSATWRLNQTVDFNAGVKNVFDKDPPLTDGQNVAAAGFDSANTFPGLYDTLGRVFFLGATARF